MKIVENNFKFGTMDIRNTTEQIVCHHSGVTVLQSVEIIHDYHKNTKGWAGIGYHFYIRKDGSIYRGRPENTVGAHAVGANYNSIGICFEGNFSKEKMGQAQLKAGQELIAYLKEKYNISKVVGHRDIDNSECPGNNFPMDEIRSGKVGSPNNSKEEIVKSLQRALNQDYNCGLEIDGIIGPLTTKAVNNNMVRNFTVGEFAKWVQERLIAKGYSLNEFGVDGRYGDESEKKVKEFQSNCDIDVDGIVGINTVNRLIGG